MGVNEMDLGYDEVVDRALEEMKEKGLDEERVFKNLDSFEAVLEMSEGFRKYENQVDRDIEHLEFGGWAIFAYIFEVEGYEAFGYWRGSGDTDKYFSPGYSSIKEAWNLVYPEAELADANNSEWGNKYSEKLSGEVDVNGGMHCDFACPEKGNEDYSFEEAKEIEIGDTSLNVPSLPDLIVSKLKSPREKDESDVVNLLYVAEEKDWSPEKVKESIYNKNEKLGERLDDIARNKAPEIREEVRYAPSCRYIIQF
ncbi:MAG: hypothetical protein SVV03_02325 [Candidatus Nanohaloarchaea archaeon]|nr:hypothetical protein [Candidatus Nanohaloarchaea archaeon]